MRYYPATKIMSTTDYGTARKIDLWKFRSSKNNKWYIVEAEHFPMHFYGIKFYWKGVTHSPNRYSLLTNDYEPRTIVNSCIQVMYKYFQNDINTSFGFIGARDLGVNNQENIPSKRFRFYRRMMLTIFGSKTFAQYYDMFNSMYLMVNRRMLNTNQLSISQIETEISKLYVGEYSFVLEP